MGVAGGPGLVYVFSRREQQGWRSEGGQLGSDWKRDFRYLHALLIDRGSAAWQPFQPLHLAEVQPGSTGRGSSGGGGYGMQVV